MKVKYGYESLFIEIVKDIEDGFITDEQNLYIVRSETPSNRNYKYITHIYYTLESIKKEHIKIVELQRIYTLLFELRRYMDNESYINKETGLIGPC